MANLFRAMRADLNGQPEIGPNARSLGVRPGTDVFAIFPHDVIQPSTGGLSVSPDRAANLPYFRRPQQLGGSGKDPVWTIDSDRLEPDLRYRADPMSPTHGFIEPARAMTLDAYQAALAATQTMWRRIP
jgi:hypothetical protein